MFVPAFADSSKPAASTNDVLISFIGDSFLRTIERWNTKSTQGLDVSHQIVNVLIRVAAEEICVRVHRRIHFVVHAVSCPRPVRTAAVSKSNREFIAIGQRSRNRLPVWQRDSQYAFDVLWIEHALLQSHTLVTGSSASKVTG